MIEYGLSVSLNTTPRPNTPTEDDNTSLTWAPRKRHSVSTALADDDTQEEEESISPRVLFREEEDEIPAIARRLDFDDSTAAGGGGGGVTMEISSFRTVSQGNTTITAEFEFEEDESIGDCGVCYSQLPLRANHIFTLCGHLFCVRCLLKWWDTNTTCPLCRAEIFMEDDSAPIIDPIPDNQSDNEEIWIRREIWNGRWPPPPPAAAPAAPADADADADADAPAHAHADTDTDENDNTTTSSDDDEPQMQQGPRTQMNLYLYQELEWNWSIYSAESDDRVIPYLTPGEIFGLRENREIAITLFARSRFRDTLLEARYIFMGRVWQGMRVAPRNWINTMAYEQLNETRLGHPTMYEFVIRRESIISPVYEINIFGFMKDVVIVAVNAANVQDYSEWENRCEYAFVAEVFTPTDFYIGSDSSDGNMVRSYGSYDITEGIINTHELIIPFSQIRRLYRINSHEQL